MYFFITDLIWITKLPKIYFVKKKYDKKVIISASIITIFLFVIFSQVLSLQFENSSFNKVIDTMELTISEDEIDKIFESLNININSISSISYDDILDGGFRWEESNYEFTEGTEKGYRIKLYNDDELIAYAENGNVLGIKVVGADEYMYKDNQSLYAIDEAKKIVDEKYKALEEELERKAEENKKLKIGETKSMLGKEMVINSVEFKKEVYPLSKSGYYNYYKADDGQVYIHILASVKNLEKQAIYCDEVINIKADYNDGYIYNAFSIVEDDTLGFTYSSIETIKPLQTKNIHYLISVPEEVQNNKEAPLILKFSAALEEYELVIR